MTPGELEHLFGRRLGHYHLQTLLGARGQAVVYRALDLLQGRDLALYVVCPGASESATFGERFRSAVARIAALKHPHILPAYEVGQDDIFSYVAVPIERESLHERFQREGILPPVDAARLMAQVAWALDALHGAGIAGLRLSMNDILLNSDNLALLADTSVAHGGTTDALFPRVATGLPIGVVQAMALDKNSASAESKLVDVYSLGTMLYELLTGGPPHSESSQQELASGMLTAMLPEEPRTTRMWPELEEVVLNALTDEPRRRYDTAREFAVAIRHAVARYDDGGAEGAPVQSLLNSHRTAPPPIRGDTGELQAKLHSPTSPPALPRPGRLSRPISRPITPRGLSTPPSPPSPSPQSAPQSAPHSAPRSPSPSSPSSAADDLPATTKLPRDVSSPDTNEQPGPPRPPTPSRPVTPSTRRPTQPPVISGDDEALMRILHPATGGPAPSGPRRPTSGPVPSGPRRPTSAPAPSSQQQHHPTAPPSPPSPPSPSSPPPAYGRPTSPPGRLRVPSQPLRPSWSSYPSQPSIPPEAYEDGNTGDFEALAAAYAIRSATPLGTRVSMPEHEQPSPTTMAALSLRALAEIQAEPQPAPRTRRAKARLLLAALLGIALVIFCASGLLVIATGRAQSATPTPPTRHPTPTATVIGSGPSFVGSALTNGTDGTNGMSKPHLARTVPTLASPSASTPTPTPAATPTPRAGADLPAAPIASAGMSGTLEAANTLGAIAASGDSLLVSPIPSATLTLTAADGLCTGTQTIANPTSYRVSWFWRQLAPNGAVLPASFRYALDGGVWTAGLPHDTALAAGATDTVSIAMPCDGNIYVLTLIDDLGHAADFFMQAPR